MKILAVQESDWIEKGPHQSHHLLERLSERGHEIRVIDFEIGWRSNGREELISKRKIFTNERKATDKGNITVIRPSIIKLPLLDYISLLYTHNKEIKRQLYEFDPEIIIGFGILNAMLAINAIKDKGIPFIYYLIDELHRLVPQNFFRPLARYIESMNMRSSDRVLVINDKLKEYAISMGADERKTFVVKAGIDTKKFNPMLNGKSIREEYDLDDSDIVLFFMGYLYNFAGLVEVSEELSNIREYPNLKFLIVGNGEAYEKLKKIRDTNGMEGRLILVNWQPYSRIPEFIAASDICVLPAHNNEIMRNIVPIKLYEYMAMGKPVVATELPGIVKEFGHENGVVYVDNPTEAIYKAMDMMENGTIREQGLKARRFVERYSWDNIVDEFERALEEVIKVRGGN